MTIFASTFFDLSVNVQLVVSGLALGAIYSVVALGFVLVEKSTAVLNLAVGEFLMLGSYFGVAFFMERQTNFFIGTFVITMIMALFGLVIHYGIMRPMVGQGFFAIVLATIGIATVIRAVVQIRFGPLEKGNLTALPTGTMEVAGANVRFVDIIVMLVVAASVGAFLAFYSLTRTGLHMRAVASNIEAAAGVGIDPDRMYAVTWAMAIGIAGLGGVMLGHFTPSINPALAAIGLRAFPAAAIGGFTSVGGAIIGGLIVGVIEQLAGGHLGTKWREPVAFGILFLVLIFKPTGLFGQKDLERI